MANLFIWYGICIAIIALMMFLSLKLNFSNELSFKIMVGVSLFSEMTKILTHMESVAYVRPDGTEEFVGYYLTPASLPFHLCSFLIFIYFYLAISKDEEKKNGVLSFVVPIGFISGLLGIAFATSGTSFSDPSTYQMFIYHSFVTWFSLFFLVKKDVDLGCKACIRNIAIVTLLSIVSIWINSILSINAKLRGDYINFMFVSFPPKKGLPLINLDYGWAPYYFHCMFIGVLLILLVHCPFMIKEKRSKGEK